MIGVLRFLLLFVGFNFAVLACMEKSRERVKIMIVSSLVVIIISLMGLYTIWVLLISSGFGCRVLIVILDEFSFDI
jgi:hypothetical protein